MLASRLHAKDAKPAVSVDALEQANADVAECKLKLARCQDRAWEVVQRAMASTPKAASSSSASPPTNAPADMKSEQQDVDTVRQRDVLAAKAMDALRDNWLKDRDKITKDLARSLGDADEQARHTKEVTEGMVRALDMDDAHAAQFRDEYEKLRNSRIQTAVTALGKDPPDFEAVIGSARSLFADEDALAERYGGDAGRRAIRSSTMEGRTVILALLATLGDRPMDEAIGW